MTWPTPQNAVPDFRPQTAQRRLRNLVEASQRVTGELDLEHVLRQIAESAVALVEAQYGALGVLSSCGGLEKFIHIGMPEDTVERIGHLPEGHGVLGAVIDSACPIRLRDLNTDPRAVGFPENHPPMDTFLGVPITIDGETFGNLYLTNRAGGPFTSDDEDLVTTLAATAAIAISNARQYGEARRAQRLSETLNEVTAALLASPHYDAFGILTQHLASLTEADMASVIVSDGDDEELRVQDAWGTGAALVEGIGLRPHDGAVPRAMDGQPSISSESLGEPGPFVAEVPQASVMAVPLEVQGHRAAALCVTRAEQRAPFAAEDLTLLSEFAGQASLAVALAWARADRHRLEIVEDRTRIARDLHDHVIQRLFGAGLGLQAHASAHPECADAMEEQVALIDAAISDIRTAVFTLQTRSSSDTPRHRLLSVVTEFSGRLATMPRLAFAGPVDLVVSRSLADDLVAVLRESLTNIARHADAKAVRIEISAAESDVTLTVDDDGVGLSAHSDRRSGKDNLAARARAHGGAFTVSPNELGGTRVQWTVPLVKEIP
ncbi:GAF domain-containing protein [Nesterenkonia sp. NBAIMH1]|uniref:sensor histidine kinase n=1 Tax=Nesterenkonia sp. NBAIMH1 TaxID=2600320 RepID=UPI00143D77E3|nr:GAF domain-containing protein [Nesterenkonia sp. NBAIMH1]